MKKRTVRYLVLGVLVAAAAVVVLNFTFRRDKLSTALPVRVHRVSTGTLEDRVSGNGSFKARRTVNVVAQVSGQVAAVRAREGDEVAMGQPLLELRQDDYRLNVDKASSALEATRRSVSQSLVSLRAQYRSASAALAEAQRAFEKNQELYAGKAISEESFRRSQDAYRNAQVAEQSAREQLNLRCGRPLSSEPLLGSEADHEIVDAAPEVVQAQLTLRSAEDSLGKCRITAPAPGTVTMITPSEGDFVAAGTPLARVESLRDIEAEVQIDEVDIGKLKLGQKAEISSDSIIGEVLEGEVTSIAPTVTSLGSTRVSLVRIRIAPVAFPLKAGASCTARIATSIKRDVLLIPLTAFLSEEGASFSYRLQGLEAGEASEQKVYRLQRVEIQTGLSNVSSIEVLSGLEEGDLVVVGNLKLLREGIYVTVKEEPA
jgi:HlyD family secretion protein